MNEIWSQIRATWNHSIFMSVGLTMFNSWDYIKDGTFILVVLNFLSTTLFVFYLLFVLATKLDLKTDKRGNLEKFKLRENIQAFILSNIFWLICLSLVILGNKIFLERSGSYYQNLIIISFIVFNSVAIIDLLVSKGLKSQMLIKSSEKLIHK